MYYVPYERVSHFLAIAKKFNIFHYDIDCSEPMCIKFSDYVKSQMLFLSETSLRILQLQTEQEYLQLMVVVMSMIASRLEQVVSLSDQLFVSTMLQRLSQQ